MAAIHTPKTLQAAVRYYSDPDVCQQVLVEARWPNGVECPHCGSKDVRYLTNQRRWQCKGQHPRRQFSVKVGSIFEDSPIGLDKWFVAIWLIAGAKNGISSYELHRAIGVTQKTAWFMLHRIRLAMQTNSFNKISGEVEVDETFIGGKARNMSVARRRKKGISQKTGITTKVAVMGLLDRHGDGTTSKIRTVVIDGRKKPQMKRTIQAHVESGATLYTDALPSYNDLEGQYVRKVIDHAEKYVDGQIHTNGLENYWSLLKRCIRGTYVSVEPFHLFRYLDEQAFRFNNRSDNDAGRFAETVKSVAGKRLMYRELTGHDLDEGVTA